MTEELQQSPLQFCVKVREARLVVERLLLTLGIPAGYVSAVRECVLHSQALGLGGFLHLQNSLDALREPDLTVMKIAEQSTSKVEADCGGVHAWKALPTIFDLGVSFARQTGFGEIEVKGAASTEEFRVATALAKRYGTEASVEVDDADTVRIAIRNVSRPQRLDQWDPALVGALYDGYDIDAELWRSLYALSKEALAPDSVLSRRHAGPIVLLDDGSILGRKPEDDDFDPEMLRNVGANTSENENAHEMAGGKNE